MVLRPFMMFAVAPRRDFDIFVHEWPERIRASVTRCLRAFPALGSTTHDLSADLLKSRGADTRGLSWRCQVVTSTGCTISVDAEIATKSPAYAALFCTQLGPTIMRVRAHDERVSISEVLEGHADAFGIAWPRRPPCASLCFALYLELARHPARHEPLCSTWNKGVALFESIESRLGACSRTVVDLRSAWRPPTKRLLRELLAGVGQDWEEMRQTLSVDASRHGEG